MLVNNDIRAEAESAKHLLKLARSEAIKRGRPVLVSSDGDWKDRWVIYVEGGEESSGYDDSDILIYEKSAPVIPISIEFDGTDSWIGFYSTGLASNNAGAAFHFCDPDNILAGRALEISAMGQVYSSDIEVGGASCQN